MALVGLYGLTSYTVRQRTPEIGVRMAMGGSRTQVAGLIVAQILVLAVSGLALGLAVSPLLTRLLATSLYKVAKTDPATLLFVSGFTILAALIACLIPAWQATAIDPMAALRCD
jgi:putative ABC transport system permease protein